MSKSEERISNYMQKFLDAEIMETMRMCYFSIRDEHGDRFFKATICELNENQFDSLFPLVSSVILTANKFECDSLNYIMQMYVNCEVYAREQPLPIFDGGDLAAPEAYLFKFNSTYLLHLNAYETGANTPGGSTDLVRYVSRHPLLKPSSLISFGICYGRNPNEQNIGDVIIPQKLYPWSIGQKITEKGFYIKHDNFNLWLEDKFSESGIYSILRNFFNGTEGTTLNASLTLSDKQHNQKNRDFSIRAALGNMSTGEAVVSSAKAKKLISLANKNDKEIGGEMEGYGLAKECIFYAQIPCFIIKAICDWGECKNIDGILNNCSIVYPPNLKDQLQAYAAFCAGIALAQLLKNKEKKLLSLEVIKWLSTKNGGARLDEYNYITIDALQKMLKNYYSVNASLAKQIYNMLLDNQIIELSIDKTQCRIHND